MWGGRGGGEGVGEVCRMRMWNGILYCEVRCSVGSLPFFGPGYMGWEGAYCGLLGNKYSWAYRQSGICRLRRRRRGLDAVAMIIRMMS